MILFSLSSLYVCHRIYDDDVFPHSEDLPYDHMRNIMRKYDGKYGKYGNNMGNMMTFFPHSEDLPYDRRRRNIMRNTVFMVNQVSGLLLMMLRLMLIKLLLERL